MKHAAHETDPGVDRTYQRLAAQIHALVVQGEFQAGDRLPSERALAERFVVSRTSVREAIIALELQGVVEVRGGSGIYVTASAAQAPRPPAFGSVTVKTPSANSAVTPSTSTGSGSRKLRLNRPWPRSTRWNCSHGTARVGRAPRRATRDSST